MANFKETSKANHEGEDNLSDIQLPLQTLLKQMEVEENLHKQARDVVFVALLGVTKELADDEEYLLHRILYEMQSSPTDQLRASSIVRSALRELVNRCCKSRPTNRKGVKKSVRYSVV